MPFIPDHYQDGHDIGHIDPPTIDVAYLTAEERFFTASEDPRVVELRDAIQALAVRIDLLVPPGRNKSIALTALEDVQMRTNRAIFAPEAMR